jgi:anti-sigma regulatory factor (Ser/Thr protein kinase)
MLRHCELIVESTEQQAEVLAPVVDDALRAGQPVVGVLGTPVARELRARLGGRAEGLQVIPAEDGFRYPVRTMAQWVDLARHLTADGQRILVLGEPVLSGTEQSRAWLQAESIFNTALAERPVTAICSYSTQHPADVVDAVHRTHTHTLRTDGTTAPSAHYLDTVTYLARHPTVVADAPASAQVVELDGPGELRALRRAAATAAAAGGLPPEQVNDFVLVVGELATNSLEHGRAPRSVRMWADSDGITCEVSNDGAYGDPYLGLLPPTPHQRRGRGVWLTRQLCDRVDVQLDGTGVRVRARMTRSEP